LRSAWRKWGYKIRLSLRIKELKKSTTVCVLLFFSFVWDVHTCDSRGHIYKNNIGRREGGVCYRDSIQYVTHSDHTLKDVYNI